MTLSGAFSRMFKNSLRFWALCPVGLTRVMLSIKTNFFFFFFLILLFHSFFNKALFYGLPVLKKYKRISTYGLARSQFPPCLTPLGFLQPLL